MKKLFVNIGLQRLEGYEPFYYKHGRNRKFEGLVSTHVVDFNPAGNPKFINMMIKCVRKALDVSKVDNGAFQFMGFDMKQL